MLRTHTYFSRKWSSVVDNYWYSVTIYLRSVTPFVASCLRNSGYVLIAVVADIHELLLPFVCVMRLQLTTLLVALPDKHICQLPATAHEQN